MPSNRLETDYSNVLSAIFELMLGAGVSTSDLSEICTSSLRRAETKVRSGRKEESGGLVTAASSSTPGTETVATSILVLRRRRYDSWGQPQAWRQ